MWCVRQIHYKIQRLDIGVLNNYRLHITNYIMDLDKDYTVDSGSRSLSFTDFPACKPCSLAECAGDFNEFMLSHLFKKNIQFYNDIKACYLQAYNDGIYEVANNIGVLLLNCENNMNEGLRWLRLAASNGYAKYLQCTMEHWRFGTCY